MSVILRIKDLTDQQQLFIRKNLTFTPKEEFRRFDAYIEQPDKLPIYLFIVEGEGDNKVVKIPLIFAASTFQIIPNIHKTFPNVNFNFTGTLRQNQVEVANEASVHLNKFGTTTLNLHPGFGKTILGAYLSSNLKKLTLVICNRGVLIKQWRKSYNDATDAKTFIVGGNQKDEDEKNIYPIEECPVILCMNSRIKQIPTNILYNIGTVMFDEAHLLCTPSNVDMLLATQPFYVIVMTATPERTDELDGMMKAIAGTHEIVRKNTKKVTVIKLMTNTEIAEVPKQSNGDTNFSGLQNLIFEDERRNNIICSLAGGNYANEHILILTKYTKHAKLLYDMLKKHDVNCGTLYGSKNNYNECRVLIGTLSKIGTGFDQQNACKNFSGNRFRILLLVCSIKKKQMLEQVIGRVTRHDSPVIIHFVDNNPIIKRHYGEAKKVYIEMNADIQTVKIP